MCGRWAMGDGFDKGVLEAGTPHFFAARGRTSSEQEAKRAKQEKARQIRSEKRDRKKRCV